MRIWKIPVGIILLLCATALVLAQSGQDLFQQGLAKEQLGDYQGAIKLYERIVRNFAKDRPLIAKATLHIGDSWVKLGSADARKSYEEVVRKYPDQLEVAANARRRLLTLDGATELSSGIRIREFTIPDIAIAISPDGRYVLGPNRGLHDLMTGSARPFDLKAGGDANFIRFTRDGKQLAYDWWLPGDHYELRVANFQADGVSQARKVSIFGNPDVEWVGAPDWTPDNKFIVFKLVRKDRGTSQISIVGTADGGIPRVLKTVPGSGPDNLFINPDGKSLAFDVEAGGANNRRDVLVLSLDGSQDETLAIEPGNHLVMGWSPDGKYLLFATEQASGAVNLRALPFANGKAQGVPRLVRPDIGQAEWVLGLTSSGGLFYTMARPSNSLVRLATFDFTTERFSVTPSTNDIAGDSPAWSRDGKYLAYVTHTAALGGIRRYALTVRSKESDRVIRELQPALKSYFSLQWAPDGQSLLATGRDLNDRPGLFRIDAHTGEVSLLVMSCDQCRYSSPNWSADGKRVYYIRTRNNLPIDSRDSAVVRDLASGTDTELLPNMRISSALTVSPDGQHIAISSNGLVSVIPAAGGEPRGLARGTVLGWAPDSRSLLVNVQTQVFRVPLEGQAHTIDLGGANFANGYVVANSDGRTIALRLALESPVVAGTRTTVRVLENFLGTLDGNASPQTTRVPTASNQQLTWVDRSGKQIEKVGPPQSYDGLFPALSPDGKRIGFTRLEPNGLWDVLVLDSDRGSMRRVTSGADGRQNLLPSWSPDGTLIAFLSRKSGKFGIHLKKADGTGNEELLLESSLELQGRLSWSPDGKTIVYTVIDPRTGADLWLLPLTGERKPVPFLQTLFVEQNAQISPDGKWLAYVGIRTGQRQVYVRPFPEGSEEWQVPVPGPDVFLPRWRSDSKELYVTAQTGGGTEIAIEIGATGSSIQFGKSQVLGIPEKSPITVDGRRFLVLKDAPMPGK